MFDLPPDWELSVFTGPGGRGGNRLVAFSSDSAVDDERRRSLPAHFGVYEVLFIDNADTGRVSVWSPEGPLRFAGHPLVGAAFLLANSASRAERLDLGHTDFGFGGDGRSAYVDVPSHVADSSHLLGMDTPEQVDALTTPPDGRGVCYAWAPVPGRPGAYRARMLAPALGVEEDEATGGMAVALAVFLNSSVVIEQGSASRIRVERLQSGLFRLSGEVKVRRDAATPS